MSLLEEGAASLGSSGNMVDAGRPGSKGQRIGEKSTVSPGISSNAKYKRPRNQRQWIQPEKSTTSPGSSCHLVEVEQPKPQSKGAPEQPTASKLGKSFRNGSGIRKVHPAETLSMADSTGTGLSNEDSTGQSAADLSTSARRTSTLWTSLRAVVNINSAFLSKKRVKNSTQRVDSFLEKFTIRRRDNSVYDDPENDDKNGNEDAGEIQRTFTLDPDGKFIFYWLFLVVMAFEYNVWFLIAREAWPGLQEQGGFAWFVIDYIFDFIFVLDICVQFRTEFLEHGILITDGKLLARHYMKSRSFALDLLALTPSDFLYFIDTTKLHTIVRIPRLLKAYRLFAFYYMAEARATLPAVFRVFNICHVLLLLVHWFAAFYFLLCEAIGFGSGEWVYPLPEGEFNSTSRMYLMSFYWSTLTLTLLGDIPMPGSEWEYVFQIISYLIGVIVFATIVGQVGIVVENRNSLRLEFERHVDNAKKYMSAYNVAKDVQNRVLLWYFYTWKRSTTDVNSLGPLPTKLRTELAMHVHLKTLKKVSIFTECPPEFLHDLVLKMHTCIYTPGDLVCRRGEVAREMFIITDGLLEVVRADGEILTTLQPGDFFGEIGILNIEGTANRRTADVRSVGYSELFTLSKGDVLAALTDFPQAQKVLEEEARRRLSINRKSPPTRSRVKPVAGTSCTEASDVEGRASNAESLFKSRNKPSSSAEPPSPCRAGTSSIGDLFRLPRSPWRQKPAVPVKPSRRKRSSKSSLGSKDNEDEAWVTGVISTVQEKLKDKLEQYSRENQQLVARIRKLEDELKMKEKEQDGKDVEINALQTRVIILEGILETADVSVATFRTDVET